MSQKVQHPRDLPEAYAAAIYTKDVTAFTALYAPEIRIFDTWDAQAIAGLEAVHVMATQWFGSLGNERVKVTFQDMTANVAENVAALHGLVTFQAIAAEGQPLRASQERISWVLEKQSGGWLVVHQHTSAIPTG